MRIGEGCGFQSFKTNNYKLHFFESPSGMKVHPGVGRRARVRARARAGAPAKRAQTVPHVWHRRCWGAGKVWVVRAPHCRKLAGHPSPTHPPCFLPLRAVRAHHRPLSGQPSGAAAVHLQHTFPGLCGEEPAVHAGGALLVSSTGGPGARRVCCELTCCITVNPAATSALGSARAGRQSPASAPGL